MELITREIAEILPKIDDTKGQKKKKLLVRLYTPWVFQSWEIAEYDPKTRLCFGWVCGLERDWKYFNLDELESIQGPYGLKVVRDINFKPIIFSKIGG